MLDRYLVKRPRSKYWQLRVPVPADLQEMVGRREETRSLRETDRAKAENAALHILAGIRGSWDACRRERATQAIREDFRDATDDDVAIIAWEAFKFSRNQSHTLRAARHSGSPATYADYVATQESKLPGLIREIHSGGLDRWTDATERMLINRGLRADRESEPFTKALRAVAEASVAGISTANREDRGEFDVEPPSEIVRAGRAVETARIRGTADLSFTALSEEYLRMWKAKMDTGKITNTEQQKRATFKLFGGFWIDRPVRGIRHEQAAEFCDILKLFDPNWARSPSARKLDWHGLVGKFGNRKHGLSVATMNRHMETLQLLWEWARMRGHCDGDNPFKGFRTKPKRGVNVKPYLAWELRELQNLFSPPPRRNDLCELMIVALFTGMRLDEIASLTWGQIRSLESGDVTIIYIQVQDAKTPAGNRQVPLHTALSWLTTKPRGSKTDRIWPTFNPEGIGKKPGADAGREFSRFKAKRGFADRTKTFHSFRKNVTRIMEQAGVPENDWAQVFGHERGFTYSVYNPDGITLRRKQEIIEKIGYPGLTIPSIT